MGSNIRSDEALKFIAYIQERIKNNPNPALPEAVFFEDTASDLLKKSGAKIRVSNAQQIMIEVFGLSTKGAPYSKFFPDYEDRAIELLNEGLSTREVTDTLEAENLIKVRPNKLGGLTAWAREYKKLLKDGKLKVDRVTESKPGTDAKIQKQKDVLVKEFLDKNPEIENPTHIAKTIMKNSEVPITANFVERSVKRQNIDKELIRKHEAIFPEVKALDEVIKSSNDILLNEAIPDTERVRELIRRFAEKTNLPMEQATENFASRIFRLGNIYAGTAGNLRYAAKKYETIKPPLNYLDSPLHKNIILMTSSAKRLSNSGMARLLGLPEKDIKVIDDTAAAMKGFGFDIAGDHTDIKGLMKNFPNYKNNFTRIEYIKDSLNKFKRRYDVKIANLARDARGASPSVQQEILEKVKDLRDDFKGQTGYDIGDFQIKNQQVVIDPRTPRLGDSPTPVNTALKKAVFNFENYVSPQIGKLEATIPETDLRVNPIDKIAFSQTSKPFEVEEVINKYKGTDIAKNSKYLISMSKVPVIGKLATAAIAGTIGAFGISKIANAAVAGALPTLPTMSLFGSRVEASEVKQPEVGTPIKYDSNVGAIVNENTDQPASQNQILSYIKDNPLKVTAGTSLGFAAPEVPGAYKAARKLGRGKVRSALGITGALKPLLTTIGTPAMTGLLEVPIAAKRLEEGESATEILTDPLGPALGVAFMEPFSRGAGVIQGAPKRTMAQGLRNYFNLSNVGQARPGLTSSILRLGMSPRMIAGATRFLGIPGLLLGTGLSAYDAYKNYQNQEGFLYNLLNRDE